MSIGKIKEYDVANGNWLAYTERIKMYFKANEIKEELWLPTLISVVGDATYELIGNLVSPKSVAACTYQEIVDTVKNHLQPKPSIMAERYQFRLRRQHVGENVAQYVAELKRLARNCEFRSSLDESLRDQLVCGLSSDVIRQRLFAEENLSYAKAVSLASALEAAEKNAAAVESRAGPARHDVEQVNAMETQGNMQCAVCGAHDHVASNCKFSSYRCGWCNTIGHLRRVCPRRGPSVSAAAAAAKPGPSRAARGGGRGTRSRGWRGGRCRGGSQAAHFVDTDQQDEEAESSEEEAIYQMSLKDYPAVSIPMVINNREVLMEVDTGSALSCINSDTYRALFNNIPLRKCEVNIKFYDGSKVKPRGMIEVQVVYNNKVKNLDLYVISGGITSLLGRQWLTELDIKIPDFCVHNISESVNNRPITMLLDRYAELFDGALGQYSGGRATLRVQAGAAPVYCRARALPYALQERVDAELDAMLANGTIEPVEFSEWATPLVIVPKPNGKIRVCADYKVTLNPSLSIDKFPLPKVEDLFSCLNGGEKFTKIDLSAAYNQILLDNESKQYTVINTHRGLFKYNRLVYGLASSPGIFGRIITNIMRGIPGVAVFMDDILVTAKNDESHVRTLQLVFERLRNNGFKLNKSKCVFLAESVAYLGYIIDKNGLHTDPDKIKAIVDLPSPTNVSEVRSFLGFVNFYARFIKNLSSHLAPLYDLLKKSVTWVWGNECQVAFENIKKRLTSTEVLAHYDQQKQLILTCDASARGVGAVLSQPGPGGAGGGGERPVAYASRALTPAERHYSQIQREALAIIFAVKKFHQYLYGRSFLLRTDHKPLVTIFGPKVGVPTMAASRLQRWAIILSAYKYDIEFVRSENNSADGLSRLPIPNNNKPEKPEQTYLHFARDAFLLDCNELRLETNRDTILGRVVSYVRDGWPSDNDIQQLQPYFNRRNEIYLELGCLMWGHRVIVPTKLRERVLQELHETHMGMVKMKSLARSYVWWAGIDEAIEAQCRACGTCAAHATAPPAHAPQRWPATGRPWTRLHIDFLGAIAGTKYMVVVDSTSKWIEVHRMGKTNASEVIKILRNLFAQFGLPKQIVSDNGPPFTSDEFRVFLSSNGITQSLTAPYHPASNGAAENAVKLCKSVIKKALTDKVDVDTALNRYLLLYRNTDHSATGESPAKILLGRSLRTRLDALKPDRLLRAQRVQEQQAEAAGGSQRELQPGQLVHLRNYGKSNVDWLPGEVLRQIGATNYRVRDNTGNETHRHIDQLKRRSRLSLVAPTDIKVDTKSGLPESETGSMVPREDNISTQSPNSEFTVPPSDLSISPGRESISNSAALASGSSSSVPSTIPSISTPNSNPEPSARPKRIRKPVKRYGIDD